MNITFWFNLVPRAFFPQAREKALGTRLVLFVTFHQNNPISSDEGLMLKASNSKTRSSGYFKVIIG